MGQALRARDQSTKLTRTMAHVGDSIRFVSVGRALATEYVDDVLTMWTLELHGEQWKKDGEGPATARELWGFDGFKEAGLPEAPSESEFPVLTADGALFVMLTQQLGRSRGPGDPLVGSHQQHRRA